MTKDKFIASKLSEFEKLKGCACGRYCSDTKYDIINFLTSSLSEAWEEGMQNNDAVKDFQSTLKSWEVKSEYK